MKRHAAIILPIMLLGAAFLVGGCMVPKDQYDKAIADLEQSRQEARQYKLELAALRGESPAEGDLTPGRPDVAATTRKTTTSPADSTDLSASKPPPATEPAVSPERAARIKALLDDLASASTSRPSPVVGKITAVKGDLAAMDVGASKGVKAGQRFFIVRGPKFVAFLLVEHVEADSAAGVISDRQADPFVGDKVTNTPD